MSSTAIAAILHISKRGTLNPFSSSPAVGRTLNVHQFQLQFFPYIHGSCQQISNFHCNSSEDTSLQLLNAMNFMVLSVTEGGTVTQLLCLGVRLLPPLPQHAPLSGMLSRSWPPLLDIGFLIHMTVISLLPETAGRGRWALSKYKLMLTFAGIMYSLEPLHLWRQ